MISVSDRAENIVGKGEKDGFQYFLLFPQYSKKACFAGWLRGHCAAKDEEGYGKFLPGFSNSKLFTG